MVRVVPERTLQEEQESGYFARDAYQLREERGDEANVD